MAQSIHHHFLSTPATLVIFWRHFQTSMVLSAGGPMSFLVLTLLLEAYRMAPRSVGPPTVFACFCCQALFTLCFTICISCITMCSSQITQNGLFKMASHLPRVYSTGSATTGPVSVALSQRSRQSRWRAIVGPATHTNPNVPWSRSPPAVPTTARSCCLTPAGT